MARRRARELAFRALFQSEQGGFPVTEVWEQLRVEFPVENNETLEEAFTEDSLKFARSLLDSVSVNREKIDQRIEELVEGWSFSQMAQTDLNILRLAVAEMVHGFDTPAEVTIEMAVRTAKKYGGTDSGRFVNGVLAQLYRDQTPAIR
ncbi:MAG: transcription antitermination factor NusB [Deinococcales bacterium]|nr:transcription antitermination factor NusB [Deinococcales bacterium]